MDSYSQQGIITKINISKNVLTTGWLKHLGVSPNTHSSTYNTIKFRRKFRILSNLWMIIILECARGLALGYNSYCVSKVSKSLPVDIVYVDSFKDTGLNWQFHSLLALNKTSLKPTDVNKLYKSVSNSNV